MGRRQDLAVTMLIAVGAWGVAKSNAFAGEPRTLAAHQGEMAASHSPTFYRDVLPILQRHCEIRDGQVHISETPGVGIEWDEKAVAASQVGLV